MRTTNLKITLVFVLANIIALPLVAQECKENYDKAENCRKKGQYDKAIRYYVQSRDCGNAQYRTKSQAMINQIEKIRSEREAVKVTSSSGTKQPYIIVPSLVYLPAGTEEQTITVESSGQWGAKGRSDIIRVSKKNSKTLTVSSVVANTSTKPRRSSVTVECGEVTRTITVEQDGVPEVLEYKSKYMNVPFEGGRFVIDLNTNTKWKVDYSSWYKVIPDENDSTRMVILIDKNTKNEDRSGTIVVRSESGDSYDEMEVHQYANESKIFAPVDSIIQFRAIGDTVYVPIITDNPTWTESDRPSWCLAKKLNQDTLMVIASKNENYISREGFVNIKSNDRVAGIWIRQEASEMPDFMSKKILGGRNISFGLSAGYVMPFINSTSSGTYTGSVINYSLGNSNEDVNYSSQTGFTIGAVADLRVYKNWYIKTGVDYTHLQYTNSFSADVNRSVAQGFNVVYQGTFQNTFKEKYKFDFISIPVLASYRFIFDKKNNLQVDLGPVLNFAVNGKMSFEGNSNSDNVLPHSVIYGETGPVIGNRSSEYMRYTGEMNLFDTKVTNTTTSSVGGMSKDFLNEYTAVAAPYNRFSLGLRVGATYEYAGIQVGVAYTHMVTNMANDSFWNSGRLPIFGQTSDVLMAGYKHGINTLELKVGYIFRYKK